MTGQSEIHFDKDENLPSVVEVSQQYDPYKDLARAWKAPQLYRTSIAVCHDGAVDQDLAMAMVLPQLVALPQPIPLFWDSETTLTLSLGFSTPIPPDSNDTLHLMRVITALYLQSPSSRKIGPERDFVTLFIPDIPLDQLNGWLNRHEGSEEALCVYSRDVAPLAMGLVRDQAKYSAPRIFRKWDLSADGQGIKLECQPLPRRRNLLLAGPLEADADQADAHEARIYRIPAVVCTVDKLPAPMAKFGLFISAILDRLEATLVAQKLNETILKGVGIESLKHVLIAISAPAAQASVNYQQYELLGDSILKFTASWQLFFINPDWVEDSLSRSRDKLVQNNRLAHAALETGLDRFILARRFTPRKWNVPLISQCCNSMPRKRSFSSKVLADVVEALIGAAYMDGGINKAQNCLYRFLPEIDLFARNSTFTAIPSPQGDRNHIDQHDLASLIGYTFNDATLLAQALTHPSSEFDKLTKSYQRLEFLGDAVLDMIIVSIMAAHSAKISQGQMTRIKHAAVNANLLAFLCMRFSIPKRAVGCTQSSQNSSNLTDRQTGICLWRALRFNGPTIENARGQCVERYQTLRDEIQTSLDHEPNYPWELFARLHPDKFFSDIIESVLGAIFVDSKRNLETCQAFLERLGLLSYVRRVIADGVNVVHPRNMAQNMVKYNGKLVFKRERMSGENGFTYRCSAVLNHVEIAVTEGCASCEEAEVMVANIAMRHLQAQRAEVEKDYSSASGNEVNTKKRERGHCRNFSDESSGERRKMKKKGLKTGVLPPDEVCINS